MEDINEQQEINRENEFAEKRKVLNEAIQQIKDMYFELKDDKTADIVKQYIINMESSAKI